MDTNAGGRPPSPARPYLASVDPALTMTVGAVVGAALGTAIGFFGAPPWEMAFFVISPLGAVTGAVAGALAAYSRRAVLASLLVSAACAGGIALVTRTGPAWVTLQCAEAVFAAGAVSAGVSFVLGWTARGVSRSLP